MVQANEYALKLDDYLKDVITAVKDSCTAGSARLRDNPEAADKAIKDAEEILDEVMAGKTDDWIA